MKSCAILSCYATPPSAAPLSFVIFTTDVNCSNIGKNRPNVVNFFEKVMYNRMIEFAERYNILHRCHFRFRKHYSTSHVLIHLINRISSAIDQRETTVGVFLDLSKAFDTLDHQILFTKLEHYGIRDVALQWIKSYFSCRQQFVQINQTCSSMQTIKCGVPLRPLILHTLHK